MSTFKTYNEFIESEHKITDSIGKIYGKRAKDTDGSLQSIPNSNSIYITFDVCSGTKIQEEVLEILKTENLPCTIFVNSETTLIDKLKGINYSIQGHSHSHKTANQISEVEQKQEIENNVKFLKEKFGVNCKYYRFPNGLSTPYSMSVLKNLGIKAVSWYNGIMDSRTRLYNWTNPTGQIIQKDKFDLLSDDELKGKIFSFHLGNNGDDTPKYLRDFINHCKRKNFKFDKL